MERVGEGKALSFMLIIFFYNKGSLQKECIILCYRC